MAKGKQNGFTVKMIASKETKGAMQYKEVNDQGQEVDFTQAKIGTLYLRKSAFQGGMPQAIQVAIVT